MYMSNCFSAIKSFGRTICSNFPVFALSTLIAVSVSNRSHAATAAASEPLANTSLEVVSEFPGVICLDTVTTSSVLEVCVALTETCGEGG